VNETKTLFKDLSVGSRARVVSFNELSKIYRNRLMSLGLTPGTEFQVQHVAPLGDPVDIRVRGFHLSLRWEEAGNIEVEQL
jgi:ferrous iron transport protein A